MPDLYDAVGHGMWAYSHAAFRVAVVGPGRFPLEPGTLIVVTHRKETDVPVVSPVLYFGSGGTKSRPNRLHFAARDDMFLPGFFAGFPPELPLRARRLLYPLSVARGLARVNVYPIRSASVARLGEVLAARPAAPLADLLPADAAAGFTDRAAALGLPQPVRASDVLRGGYADLLWRAVEAGDLGAGLEDFWSARAARAAADFRTLVEIMRDRKILIVFPEGHPSRDGEIGPIRPGVGALVRRGRPPAVRPLALAYDPLGSGRTRVHVALGEPIEPPGEDVEETLLGLMRVTMPLTSGQVVAAALERGAEADPAALLGELTDAVEAARDEGRPIEQDLATPEGRRRRLAEALAAAPSHAAELSFLAREYASARPARTETR